MIIFGGEKSSMSYSRSQSTLQLQSYPRTGFGQAVTRSRVRSVGGVKVSSEYWALQSRQIGGLICRPQSQSGAKFGRAGSSCRSKGTT